MGLFSLPFTVVNLVFRYRHISLSVYSNCTQYSSICLTCATYLVYSFADMIVLYYTSLEYSAQ